MSWCIRAATKRVNANLNLHRTSESGLASFTSYASAFFQALTPVENRIESMPTTTPSPISKRLSQAGNTGNMGGHKYAAYKSKNTRGNVTGSASAASSPVAQSSAPIPGAGPSEPAQAYMRSDQPYAAYSSSSYANYSYDPEMPSASGSSSRA